MHRHSRSAGGEKWVDHKPSSSLDLGTVLQPVIPNAIQVSAPNSVMSQLLYNIPPLPCSELTDPRDDITLPRLIEALQNRHRIRQMMIDEYTEAASMMKSMLQEVDSKFIFTENIIHEQNSKLVEKDTIIQNNKAQIERLEKKAKTQEQKINMLQKMTEIYEDDKRLLQHELETREQRLQRELSDKRCLEQRMHSVVTDIQLKCEEECGRRIKVVQQEMEGNLWTRDEKLKQLKAIVMETPARPDPPPRQTRPKQPPREEHLPANISSSPSSLSDQHIDAMQPTQPSREEYLPAERSASPSPLPSPVDSPRPVSNPVEAVQVEEVEMEPRPTRPIPSTSNPFSVTSCISAWEQRAAQESRQGYYSPSTPTSAQSPAGLSARRARRRAVCHTREEEDANSPPFSLDLIERSCRTLTPVRPLHQRSCSAGGEKWVDHKPSSSLDLGTVLQPVIPNAIQVSAPSEKALSKCDRYVLTHQEVASDGEIETKLIKGEVIKTRGGGQAVQFTDIETLKQELTTVPR
ncbi:Kinesin-like protein KIF23 [Collichthys lucidus]|uniref:Kinesin-like protein KIF23 n=1 Tax=Collichthys lucidus TaxID=240159 RepID=A0A4U5UH72_COLLU|nr:Kinesin-like protein KIF23 [Collichthys lucidus]